MTANYFYFTELPHRTFIAIVIAIATTIQFYFLARNFEILFHIQN